MLFLARATGGDSERCWWRLGADIGAPTHCLWRRLSLHYNPATNNAHRTCVSRRTPLRTSVIAATLIRAACWGRGGMVYAAPLPTGGADGRAHRGRERVARADGGRQRAAGDAPVAGQPAAPAVRVVPSAARRAGARESAAGGPGCRRGRQGRRRPGSTGQGRGCCCGGCCCCCSRAHRGKFCSARSACVVQRLGQGRIAVGFHSMYACRLTGGCGSCKWSRAVACIMSRRHVLLIQVYECSCTRAVHIPCPSTNATYFTRVRKRGVGVMTADWLRYGKKSATCIRGNQIL